jgi:hypothetical protein
MKPILLAVFLSLLASNAAAEPGFARLYRGKYGYEPACTACHSEGGGSPLNAYGEAFKKAGKTSAAFAAIEALDSDGDGAANLAEIKAKANPGAKQSNPANPGEWLDPSNLIPAEVQKIFPGVHSYKPLDAIFTPKEIERARKLGVSLSESDETTIYVPFDAGQAQGAAVIVPAAHQGKQSFLVVATDRSLNVKSVVPIATKETPPPDAKAYSSLIGKHVDQIVPPDGLGRAEAAAAAAVQKAAVILFVRLTKD